MNYVDFSYSTIHHAVQIQYGVASGGAIYAIFYNDIDFFDLVFFKSGVHQYDTASGSFTPAPEPYSITLLATAVVGLGAMTRRRRDSRP